MATTARRSLGHVTWFDERLGESPPWSHLTNNTFIDIKADSDEVDDRAALLRGRSAPARAKLDGSRLSEQEKQEMMDAAREAVANWLSVRQSARSRERNSRSARVAHECRGRSGRGRSGGCSSSISSSRRSTRSRDISASRRGLECGQRQQRATICIAAERVAEEIRRSDKKRSTCPGSVLGAAGKPRWVSLRDHSSGPSSRRSSKANSRPTSLHGRRSRHSSKASSMHSRHSSKASSMHSRHSSKTSASGVGVERRPTSKRSRHSSKASSIHSRPTSSVPSSRASSHQGRQSRSRWSSNCGKFMLAARSGKKRHSGGSARQTNSEQKANLDDSQWVAEEAIAQVELQRVNGRRPVPRPRKIPVKNRFAALEGEVGDSILGDSPMHGNEVEMTETQAIGLAQESEAEAIELGQESEAEASADMLDAENMQEAVVSDSTAKVTLFDLASGTCAPGDSPTYSSQILRDGLESCGCAQIRPQRGRKSQKRRGRVSPHPCPNNREDSPAQGSTEAWVHLQQCQPDSEGALAELETQKQAAISREDYLEAHRIKLEMESMRSQEAQNVAKSLVENTDIENPMIHESEPEPEQSITIAKSDQGVELIAHCSAKDDPNALQMENVVECSAEADSKDEEGENNVDCSMKDEFLENPPVNEQALEHAMEACEEPGQITKAVKKKKRAKKNASASAQSAETKVPSVIGCMTKEEAEAAAGAAANSSNSTANAEGGGSPVANSKDSQLTQKQAQKLAELAVRLNEQNIALHLRATASRRLLLATPVDPLPISGDDLLAVEPGDVVHCELTDSGWGFGTIVAPLRLAGRRGCFTCGSMRPVIVEVRTSRGGDTLEFTSGEWSEVAASKGGSAKDRLREKAALNRVRAARASWEKKLSR